jgi:hypothetical protein
MDLLLCRYQDMNFIMSLDPVDVIGLIAKAEEKREEEKAWQMWVQLYPNMIIPRPFAKDPALKFIPFSDFYKKMTQPISQRPAEDILKEAEEIRKRARKEGEIDGNI